MKPILKTFGGKSYLAPKIIDQMPRHLHYVEPYAGGLAVLLERDLSDQKLWWGTKKANERGVSEVVNDIDGRLTGFWRTLQDRERFGQFLRAVEAMPFSQKEWQDAEADLCHSDDVRRAVAFFVFCRQSRAGQMRDFSTLSRNRTRRGMSEQASAWLGCVERLPAVHKRLKRVVIYNDNATKVIAKEDGEKTLFYADPPYPHGCRTGNNDYRYEMTDGDHEVLLKTLAAIKGKFILSGYPSELYANYANEHGWRTKAFDLPNNAAGGRSKRRMQETVWMNYERSSR